MSVLSEKITFLSKKIMFKSHQIKSNQSPNKNEVDTHGAPAFAPDYSANVLAAKSILSIQCVLDFYVVNQLP
jgi:hypothetical protein